MKYVQWGTSKVHKVRLMTDDVVFTVCGTRRSNDDNVDLVPLGDDDDYCSWCRDRDRSTETREQVTSDE